MRILLVEPKFRRSSTHIAKNLSLPSASDKVHDNSLWYPPLGLMKLSTFHKNRGDYVEFVSGYDKRLLTQPSLFTQKDKWDRIYIFTLFTFNWQEIVRTIEFYKKNAEGIDRIFVGGIMASLVAEELHEETGVYPIKGLLTSPQQIGLLGNENIDRLPPDYSLYNLDNRLYAINETYYAYTSRGCINNCGWCGVPKIEPEYIPYIDIKDLLLQLRKRFGDKPILKLMDNNVLASPHLEDIVNDLLILGYGKNEFNNAYPRMQRIVDFNQGLDASYINEHNIKLISKLNIKPVRIAFDSVKEKQQYTQAIMLAQKHGFKLFSNYILYNWNDNPKDLYERLILNIKTNQRWRENCNDGERPPKIFCYPMRYAPINGENHASHYRDYVRKPPKEKYNHLNHALWTKRFIRNVEIMRGAAHGAISSTPSLALRTIGETYEDFIANLYMPEEFLRNRNKYEERVYPHEPRRKRGSGELERFRKFILNLLRKQDMMFFEFHKLVSENSKPLIRGGMKAIKHKRILKWLKYYLI